MTDAVVAEARRLVAQLRQEQEQELEREQDRWRVALDGARDALQAIGEAPTPTALLERAPAALGTRSSFARVLLSTISQGALTEFQLWERDAGADPGGWEDVSVPLAYPLAEADLLRSAGARVVHVESSHGRTPEILRERLGWSTYVAAAVVLSGRPRWMLHAHLDAGGDADAALEVQVLGTYAAGLGRTVEVAFLRRLLIAHRSEQLRAAHSVIERLESTDPVTPPAEEPAGEPTGDELTARERQVMVLMIQGMTNAAIAQQLLISGGTVKYHVANVLSKLGASSRADAVARYMRKGP